MPAADRVYKRTHHRPSIPVRYLLFLPVLSISEFSINRARREGRRRREEKERGGKSEKKVLLE